MQRVVSASAGGRVHGDPETAPWPLYRAPWGPFGDPWGRAPWRSSLIHRDPFGSAPGDRPMGTQGDTEASWRSLGHSMRTLGTAPWGPSGDTPWRPLGMAPWGPFSGDWDPQRPPPLTPPPHQKDPNGLLGDTKLGGAWGGGGVGCGAAPHAGASAWSTVRDEGGDWWGGVLPHRGFVAGGVGAAL